MEPDTHLPYCSVYGSTEDYVDALLHFVTESDMLQTLCGGVHVLDFLTRDPDLFAAVLPQSWRDWLSDISIPDFLDFLMRDHLDGLMHDVENGHQCSWRGRKPPPLDLLAYVRSVRNLSLGRGRTPSANVVPGKLGRRLAMGMKEKKAHEVEHFAAYVDSLIDEIGIDSGISIDSIVDFGSGQNYLGRVLASPLYQRQVIAVEGKHRNISGAMSLDVSADLAKKIVIWRNKKVWRSTGMDNSEELRRKRETTLKSLGPESAHDLPEADDGKPAIAYGKIHYIEHRIMDGSLTHVLGQLHEKPDLLSRDDQRTNGHKESTMEPLLENLMVVSLHSCGNLLHHGLRSLAMNPEVKAVAMVGCCYNLLTERLGPPTKKHPTLRNFNQRLEETSSACDPHGFPMSERLASYPHTGGKGVRMNITARMMAVQAPQNWLEANCNDFFTRHFFRALLQRILLDRGFVKAPLPADDVVSGGVAPADSGSGGEPVIIGSLRKTCYASFLAYVRGALEKIMQVTERPHRFRECMDGLTDEEILNYERLFKPRKHHLSLIWSLMAFSACVVESLIVTDRWLYLKEQPEVKKCWVQAVFDYQQSPRNLVVVGIRK